MAPVVLSEETYASLRDHVLPRSAELRWRDIGWRVSFRDAVVEAWQEEKPMLLWAMDGHPLGSTCNNGIAGRLVFWRDPAVQRLAAEFVAVADDSHRLRRGTGAECDLFRGIVEQGHFAGRVLPTPTRQGIYAATPGGRLLGSVNPGDARGVEQMLATALERWSGLTREERFLPPEPGGDGIAAGTRAVVAAGRAADIDPDGLVLRVYARDLPRGQSGGEYAESWNQDHAWLSADEARSLVPGEHVGDRSRVPEALARRLARLHLVDNVRGQADAFEPSAIEKAELWTEIVETRDGTLVVSLEGHMRAVQRGTWCVHGEEDFDPSPQERGYDMSLLGRAVFSLESERFTEFELLAAGIRWGGSHYNFRGNDLAPAPIGIVFVLADDALRVPAALR